MTRIQAFVLNLAVSLLLLLVPLYLAWSRWYTPPLFLADGGWKGFWIMAVVLLLVGPGLTLLLFKPGKKGLWYDMVIVIALQIGVLGWGSWTLYHERPVALVFGEGYFIPVTAYQLAEIGIDEVALDRLDRQRPALIRLDLPEDEEAMQDYRRRVLATGVPLYLFAGLYRPFDTQALDRVRRWDLDMERLYADKPAWLDVYRQFRARQGERPLIFVPLHARHRRYVVALDANTGRLVETLKIHPPRVLQPRRSAASFLSRLDFRPLFVTPS